MQDNDKKINQQEQQQNKIAFYERLQEELHKNTDWPTKYMYKFIVPNREDNLKKIEKRFSNQEVTINKNYSKTGKYVSVTVITREDSPEAVINRYKSMEDIDGLVAL
jgi:putative lipoic acid-binding regulatory protein